MSFRAGQKIRAYHQECEVLEISGGQPTIVGWETENWVQKPIYVLSGNEVKIAFPDGTTIWENEETILFHMED